MGKYNTFQKKKELKRDEIHPVWRGIGFLIMLLTPVISGAAAMVLVDIGKSQNWPFIASLSGHIYFPDAVYHIPGILVAANYVSGIPYLQGLLIFFVAFMILFSGVFAFLNAVFYRMVGPPRYTPLDEPAPRVKTKRYTR